MSEQAKATMKVDEAAEMLGISRAAAYRAVNRGDLPSVRIGRAVRVLRAPVEKMLADGTGTGTGTKPATVSAG